MTCTKVFFTESFTFLKHYYFYDILYIDIPKGMKEEKNMKLKNITGNDCGEKLKKFGRITFYIFLVLAVLVALFGIFGGMGIIADGDTGTGMMVLFIAAVYIVMILFFAYIAFLKTYAYGNMVQVQEKQYALLQDLYKKLYDDGTLNNQTDKLEF